MRTVKIKDIDGDEIRIYKMKNDSCDISICGAIEIRTVIFVNPAPLTRLIDALTTARDEMIEEQKNG